MFPYLHGFDETEQDRLRRQAEFMEQEVYREIDFSECRKIIEIGCGVGAQTAILLRRFPKLHVTAVDANDAQLETCHKHLSSLPYAQGRFEIKKMDAMALQFSGGEFDGAFLCWILEHVPDPKRVLSEARRVIKAGGRLYATEVMNHSFFLDPYSPHVWKYWMAFNDFQFDTGGDPFIGAKLGNILNSIGFRWVETRIKTSLLDNRYPERRRQSIAERKELLLSAAEQLIKSKYVTPEELEHTKKELESVERHPDAVIMDSFMQVLAT